MRGAGESFLMSDGGVFSYWVRVFLLGLARSMPFIDYEGEEYFFHGLAGDIPFMNEDNPSPMGYSFHGFL